MDTVDTVGNTARSLSADPNGTGLTDSAIHVGEDLGAGHLKKGILLNILQNLRFTSRQMLPERSLQKSTSDCIWVPICWKCW